MILVRPARLAALLSLSMLLAACGGGKGSTANPPPGVTVLPGDQSLVVNWTADPNVEYWVFYGPPGTNQFNFDTIPGASVVHGALPPLVVSSYLLNGLQIGLINGQSYTVSINGRVNGGPGGAATTPVTVTPRAAGANWQLGPTLTNSIDGHADALLAGSYGQAWYYNNGLITAEFLAPEFVLVGQNGAAFYSTLDPTGQTFSYTPTVTGVTSGTDLTGVISAPSFGFLAVGTGGQASYSLDGMSWVPQSSGTTQNFRGIGAGAQTAFLAVGDNCSVFGINGGGTTQTTVWADFSNGFRNSPGFTAACSSATPPSLRAVAVGNYAEVMVGSQGVLAYTSATAYASNTTGVWVPATITWPGNVAPASYNLNAVTYGVVNETQPDGTFFSALLWVAVGDYTDGSGTHPLIIYTTNAAGTNSWVGWNAIEFAAQTGSLHAVNGITDPGNGGLTQLVAAGDQGLILRDLLATPVTDTSGNVIGATITSTPAQSWSVVSSGTVNPLYALVFGHNGLQAPGAAGTRAFTN
ncbi:MAG: hypothetical protein KGI67_04370 [Pseudomonadota bacterium]|nr:hypothetical protein [Pseudomonadota bacterium]